MKVPRWLGGIGLMVVGMALGAVALGQGEISLVEPLLATNLLFALALSRHQTKQSLGRQGWAGLALLAGGVTTFIVAGEPHGGSAVSDPLRHWLIIGVMVGLALLLTTYAKRSRLSSGPVLLSLAAGLLYGVQDALTRVSGQRFGSGGLGELLTGWQPYAVLALGVTGLVLVQSAFETAPLRMSLPALTAAQPRGDHLRGRLPRRPAAHRHRRAGPGGGGAGSDRRGHRAPRAAPGDAAGHGAAGTGPGPPAPVARRRRYAVDAVGGLLGWAHERC